MDQTPEPDAAPDGGDPRPFWSTPDPAAPGQTGADGFFASIRRTQLVRSDERWIGGVAGGVALRLGIDPLIVRGLFGIGALLGGVGLVLYGVGWLLMPEQRDGRIHLQQLFRGDFDAAVIGGFALLLLGFAYPDQWHWFGGGGRWFGGSIVGVVAIAAIIALIISSRGRRRSGGPSTALPVTPPFAPQTPPGRPTASYPTASYPTAPYPTASYPTTPYPTTPYPTSAPVPPATSRPEGPTMYPAPPAPGQTTSYPPHAGAGPWAPVPPYRPVPAVPVTTLPRTRAEGPGGRPFGIVVALSLILLAALLYADRVDAFDGPVMLTVAACVVIMSGIGIAIAGAMGRRSGGLGAVAIITLLFVVPASAATDIRIDGSGTFIGDGTYTPRSIAAAEEGYRWTLGDVTVDLTELPAGSDVTVPLHLGTGDLQVVVPAGAAVTAEVHQGVGDTTWLDDAKVSGLGNDRSFESPAVVNGATPDIELDIHMGAGTLTVVEQS